MLSLLRGRKSNNYCYCNIWESKNYRKSNREKKSYCTLSLCFIFSKENKAYSNASPFFLVCLFAFQCFSKFSFLTFSFEYSLYYCFHIMGGVGLLFPLGSMDWLMICPWGCTSPHFLGGGCCCYPWGRWIV